MNSGSFKMLDKNYQMQIIYIAQLVGAVKYTNWIFVEK